MDPKGDLRANEAAARDDFADRHRALGFGAIGLAQGAVFVLAHEIWPENGGAAVARSLVPSLFAAVAGLCLQFTWTDSPRRRWLAVAALTAFAFALPALWVYVQFGSAGAAFEGDQSRAISLWLGLGIALYVLGPYLQLYVESGTRHFPYPRLFFHAWNNALVALFGLAYVGVFSVLVLLCRGLFSVLGIEVVSAVIDSPRFWLASLPVMFGVGAATGIGSVRLIDSLRATLLAVFRFLIPLYALISIAFLLALPFTGLKPVWDTGYASYMLLSTVVLGALFLNALLEDGSHGVRLPRPLRALVAVSVIGLPVYAALALYSLWLRIDQHGLSPERIFGMVVAIVLALYASSYAVSVARWKAPWMATLAVANVALSLVVVALAFALHSPLLDPLSLSVRSQVARLLAGRVSVDDFDFANLRFELGSRGYAALQELSTTTLTDGAEEIRAKAAEALAAEQRSKIARHLSADDLEWISGTGGGVPEGLIAALNREINAHFLLGCTSSRRCAVFEVDLIVAGTPSFCVVVSDGGWAECFERQGETWRGLGRLLAAPGVTACGPGCDLNYWVRHSQPTGVEPLYRDVRIGQDRFQLRGE